MQKTNNLDDLAWFLDRISASSYDVIYIVSDMVKLGLMQKHQDPRSAIEDIAKMFYEKLPNKTVIFPTATLDFTKNDEVFDARLAPSKEMGVLNETFRIKYADYRSAHPLWSHGGWGPKAISLLGDVPPNAYGFDSVWERMLNYNTLSVNLGVDFKRSMTVIHHIEQIHGVPYRFSKAFKRTTRNYAGSIETKIYTLNVIRKNIPLIRDGNEKLCSGYFPYQMQDVFNDLQSYDYKNFYDHLVAKIKADLFVWVKNVEEVREYCLSIAD